MRLHAPIDHLGNQVQRPLPVVLPDSGCRPSGVRDARPMWGQACRTDTSGDTKEVIRMRAKLSGWKHLLFTAATLATIALAAGARYKPN